MARSTVLVVPAPVPAATVTALPTPPDAVARIVPVQPRPVPAASVLAVRLAAADAETVRRLQAEIAVLRAHLSG